jgi:RNA polymerase sigma factor (sigma-70 family)
MVTGDRAAAHDFVSAWQPRIERWIAARTLQSRVDDFAQEVWLHLAGGNWLRLLQWRGLYDDEAYHAHSLEAFLKRITIRKIIDLQGTERLQQSQLDPADIVDDNTELGRDPALGAERSRLRRVFDACSRLFKRKDHRAIQLWWEGYSAREIGEQLDTNPNNVYQRRSYLLKQLRDCLVEKLPEYFRHV